MIPLALLGAFMLLDYEHIPANLISMGAIDFGIIVDSAVVIIENIIHLVEARRENGLTVRGAIIEGTAQMAKPILFSKVILLTAFLPLYTMQRVEGRIFRPMALTLTFAIIAGTVLAIVAVPCLASFFLREKPPDPRRSAGRAAWVLVWLAFCGGATCRCSVLRCAAVRSSSASRSPRWSEPSCWAVSWAASFCPSWTKAPSGSA